ncbi:MAG: hypothetical protein EBT56_16090, partial [Betaproteobacteria bacterium]|nr:hypothetical protein [Betaproteobacteria bacterium]
MASFDASKQLDMYRFFLVAFDAAPGVTYWGQLKAAVESGLDTKAIVNIFTTKQQFLSVYPNDLSGAAFSKQLIDAVIKNSASQEAKAQAIKDVQSALEAGMSRGDVLYTVFGNLAARELDP